jgi:NADH-quinone oxidoreductase subunit M
MNQHLLSITLWLPVAAAFVLLLIPKRFDGAFRAVGLVATLLTFLVSLQIVFRFQNVAAFQLTEIYAWIPRWGIKYALGVDGISLWLVLLTTLMGPIVVLQSWGSITKHPKEYIIAMLVLESAMIGAFISLDLLLFYIFFELMLLPMYLIIGVWGGKNRIYAAIKFFLFTIFGSLLMLLGIIYLVFQGMHQSGGTPSFAITDLYGLSLSPTVQALLFFAFALAFAIKVPLFPLHTWLPDAHVEAPTGGSIVLAAVMLKMGTYGFLRFVLPFFPHASAKYAWLLLSLSVIGIIYGALVAWVQPDMKKLVAYSSVSHLGFCVLGIFAMNQTSVEGSILQMVNHGLSTGALFLLVGVIYDRRHTRLLADYGGIARTMPVYAVCFIIAMLSSVGLPGLNGFIGEFLVLSGTFQTHPYYAVVASTGVILAAIYLLWLIQSVFFGPIKNDENKHIPDIRWNELLAFAPLLVFIVWIGVHPNTFLDKMHPSVQQLMIQVKGYAGTTRIMTAQEAGEALSKVIPGIHVVDPHAIPESGNAPTPTTPPPTGSASPAVPPAVPPAVNQ